MKSLTRSAEPEFAGWNGLRVDVERLYEALTARGWKIDTEESNLMLGFSKTWHAAGVKVWVYLAQFVIAPPYDEVERLDVVRFHRFDPAAMPNTPMAATHEDGTPLDRDEWGWLVDHGDAQTDQSDLLSPLPLADVPERIWAEVKAELEPAVAAAVVA